MLRRNLKPIFSVISLFVLLTAEECGCRNFENDPHRADYDLSAKMHKDTLFLDDGDYTEVTLDINAKSEVAEICDFYITEWSVNNDVQGELRSDDAKTTIDIKELKFKKGQTKLTYKPTKTGQHTLTFKIIDKWKDLEKEAKTNTITVKQKKDFECYGGSGLTVSSGKDGTRYYPINLKIGSMDKELKGAEFKVLSWSLNGVPGIKIYKSNGDEIFDFGLDSSNNKTFYIKAPTETELASSVPPTITATISCDGKITKYVSISLDEVYQDARNQLKIQKQKEKDLLIACIRKNGVGLASASDELKNDKEVVLEAVKANGRALQYASDSLKDDHDIVLEAFKQDKYSFQYASERLRDEKAMALEALKQDGDLFKYAGPKLKDDEDVVLEAIKKNGDLFKYAGPKLKDDKDFVLEALLEQDGDALFKHASTRLRHDKAVVMRALRYPGGTGDALQYTSAELRGDKDFVLKAVKKWTCALGGASDYLKNDRTFIISVVRQKGMTLKYVSNSLKKDRALVLEAIKQDGKALEYAAEELKRDRGIVIEAVKQNGMALKYASEELRNDKEIILEAIKNDSKAFEYVPEYLKSDKAYMLEVGKQVPGAWVYASEELQNDLHFVLESLRINVSSSRYIKDSKINSKRKIIVPILQQNGKDLEHVRPEFKGMKKVVLEAVKQNGEALKYAAVELRGDREVVLEAVKQNGEALKYASTELRNDQEVVMEAVKQNGGIFLYASDELRNNQEIVLEAAKQDTHLLGFASDELKGDTKFCSLVYQTLSKTRHNAALRFYVGSRVIRGTSLSLEGLTAPVINLDLEDIWPDFYAHNYRHPIKVNATTMSGIIIKFLVEKSATIGDVARKTVMELRKEEKLTEEIKRYLYEFPFIYLVFKEQSFSQKDEYRKLSELLV